MTALVERTEQYGDIWENDYLRSLDDLQIWEVADYYRVPPSWVREHMTPYEVRQWGEFMEIKADRQPDVDVD